MSNRGASGFSLIELLIVIVLLGALAAIGVPRVRGALLKQNVKSARVAAVAQVVKARSAAVQRGCRGVVHLRDTGAIWVTACRMTGAGVDTLGQVDNLRDRYGVTLSATRDSVQFDPRGLSLGNQSANIVVANAVATETIAINAIGRVTQ
jgi:prepilin-type N-terminal cleavage/methylation domain-containing protein